MATAFTFLTRLPVRSSEQRTVDIAAAATWFPLVGAVVGAIVGLVHFGLQQVVPTPVAAAVAVAVGVLVTGAFHEDGLGDVADGFGGGWTIEERLEIMADPRQGTYGVAAIVCSIAIRVTALAAMEGAVSIAVLVGVHLLARNLAGLGLALGRPAQREGLAATMIAASDRVGTNGRRRMVTATLWLAVFVALIGSTVGPAAAVAMVAVAAAAGLAVIALARSKIGGVTGDVLGAVEQLAEVSALVAAAAFVPF